MEPLTLIPVDKTIFESLENIIEAQVRRLACDIAKTLQVDEKPLIQELRKQKIKTYFYEEEHDKEVYDMKCKAFNKDGAIYTACSDPIVFKKDFCVIHLTDHAYTRESIKKSEEIYLIHGANKKEYYYDSKKNIYDSNLNIIHGKIDEDDKTITIYTLSKAI